MKTIDRLIENAQKEMIIAHNVHYSMDTYATRRNNNVLVVGTSGCGKTRSIVSPNILQATGSYIISDPKGNLYEKYGDYLKAKGYRVMKLDFIHPEKSVKYNPLAFINTTADVRKICEILVEKGHKNADPFWDKSARILLESVISYLLERGNIKERTMGYVLKLLGCCTKEDIQNGNESLLEQIIEAQGGYAYKQYQKVKVAAEKTMQSIMISLYADIGCFDLPELQTMMSENELDICGMGREKTALFVVASDTDRSMDRIVNLFYSQAMDLLCHYADEKCIDNHLPVPVRFIMDDFATNCIIADFPRIISMIRSRGISTMLMIQSESQLRNYYGEDANTIITNCDTYVYMGGSIDQTVDNVARRANCSLEKIFNMPVGTCWVFRRGEKPVFANNFDLEYFENWKRREIQETGLEKAV